jgi:NADP-dependent 3-hydroxy acid dehydrogenase YdfG
MPQGIKDKVVVITGASSGLGEAATTTSTWSVFPLAGTLWTAARASTRWRPTL